jgi:hypothetical protein
MRGVHAAALIALALSCGGCAGGGSRSLRCAWPDEAARRLDLRTNADQRHLNADARVAEELAIRYADVRRGHRSGHFSGFEEYHRTRDQCLASLAGEIANRHAISPSEVAGAVGRRDGRLDAFVLLVFAALYAFAANRFLRRLFARFPADDPWPALIGTAASAIGVSAVGVILGGLGATIVEMIQLGDTHMSYRADRLPWSRHAVPLFVGGMILFSLIAVVRWLRGRGVPPAAGIRLTR